MITIRQKVWTNDKYTVDQIVETLKTAGTAVEIDTEQIGAQYVCDTTEEYNQIENILNPEEATND